MIKTLLTSIPAEVAIGMFEVMLDQERLIEEGIRCDRCGKLTLPEDMYADYLCIDCADFLVEMALEAEQEALETIKIAEEISDIVEEFMDITPLTFPSFNITIK
ncbi:MAG: hypothetical protein RR358_05915 [Cetobacterium sp.]